ncbi:hypothetical protein FOA52_011807 [Chlamydomonas sp. UWO 241]|nr:hypothetical protein FOA52_011807 [Chlamydomonas sp. UWO 241]
MFLAALWVCWVFFMPGRYQQSPMGSPGVSSHPSPRRLMVRDGSTAAFQGFSLPWSERQGSAVTETTSADVVPYLAKLLGASPDPPDRPVNRVTVIKGEGADEAVDIISNEPGRQPLYRIAHNFLADAQFERIRAALIESTIAHAPCPLNSNGFSLTTGAMFSFSAAGEKVFRALLPSCPELAAVWEFFGTIRRPDTNAFVINVLRATGTDNTDGATPDIDGSDGGDPYGVTAGSHWDNTLRTIAIEPQSQNDEQKDKPVFAEAGQHTSSWQPEHVSFVSYQTTVIYLQVPPDMIAGAYVIENERTPEGALVKGHNTVIKPIENTVVAFRGDAPHHVQGFHTNTGLARISLVVEQYRIADQDMHRVQPYYSSIDPLSLVL